MAKINTKIIKVETSVARPIDLQIFRGEKVPIELHFANYGQCLDITGYSVEAYYQSPDMGENWYKDETAGHLVIDESGEFVTWLWTPDIDAGEDKYKWFVRVYKSGDEDDSYRAFGTIEMLASPAHNQIQPLPVPPIPIDCSKYEWLNAPWYTKEETDEAIADAISEIPAPDYPVTSVNGKTGAVVLSPSDVGAATAAQGAKADRAVLYRTDVATAVDIGNRNSGTTVGAYSVVEGVGSTATGFSAHAEGASTASGPYSHAEGSSSTAAGYYSHAEGSSTTAAGSHAHSEGENTSATGYASHAEGFYTEAKNHSEHAQGYCNLSHTGNTDAGKTIHSIGVGATIFARSNAVEVMRDGKVFIKGVGNYDGTNPATSGVKDLATEISGKATQQYVDDKIAEAEPPDGSITTSKLADGAVTPDKLSEKYLRDTATDQYSHQVDYFIQSKFNGTSYFDVNPVWHINVEGVTHTVELLSINPFDWYGYAIYRDGEGISTWQGSATGCSVYLSVDDGEELEVGNLNATISRVSDAIGGIVLDVYDGQSFGTSQFGISLRLEVNTVDAYLVTHGVTCDLKSRDPSLLGFVCNHGEGVDVAIATDEIYWGGYLAPDSYVDRKIAEAVGDGSITTAKLADGAVTSTKLADFSVTTNKIAAGSVTPDKLNRAYVTDFGTSTSATRDDDEQHLTPILRNGYYGLAYPQNGNLDIDIIANNDHNFNFDFTSFPMPDVVKMARAGTDGTFRGLEPLNLECEVTVTDEDTDNSVHAYPVLDWTFSIDINGNLYAEGVGYFEEDIPMHMWMDFEKEGNVVKCYHVYIVAGDAQHTILGTDVDNDTDDVDTVFETDTPASLGRLVTELDLQANQVEVAQSDWNETVTTAPDYIKNKPVVLPLEQQSSSYYKSTIIQRLMFANGDDSKEVWIQVPTSTSPAGVGTNGRLMALELQRYTEGAPANPLAIPAGADANDAVARTSDLPTPETWTFTLQGGTTITKSVAVY